MAESGLNQAQIEYWNGPGAQRWVSQQERLDQSFTAIDPIGAAGLAARGGERIIDLGCGCGASTLQIADAVGPPGAVLGVDVSGPMLARARERAEHRTWIQWLEADAATHQFVQEFDALYSRFGFMFFDAPTQAFANLRRALQPGGRACLLCWRSVDQNLWWDLPVRAAETVVPPLPAIDPEAPGPFAFSHPARLRAVLSDAGFSRIDIEPADVACVLSTKGLDDAVAFAIEGGPVARMLADATAEARAAVQQAVKAALSPHATTPRVELPAGLWVVTAHAP